MAAQWGEVIYCAAVILAGVIAFVVVIGYASDSGEGDPVISIAGLMASATIFLVGWTCRLLLTAR